MTGTIKRWYTEPVLPTLHHSLELKAVHYRGRTRYQDVQIIDTNPFGTTLVLDGKTQSAESDEFIYHEGLVHPALIGHSGPRRVLIAGGGEGATLREVLAHRTVEEAVMVDLDEELVALCRERLPQWHRGAFDDPRSALRYADVFAYLESEARVFDAIIVDVTDPSDGGPSTKIFSADFYSLARDRLAPGGVLATQAGPATHGMEGILTAVANTVRSVFGTAHVCRIDVLSFGSDWGIVLAATEDPKAAAAEEIDRRIADRVDAELRFYDGEAHRGMFGLPKWLRRSIEAETRLITEASPVFMP